MMDTTYLYNAYCSQYDENYILNSSVPLPTDTMVKDEDCTSKILGAYQPTSIHCPIPNAYHSTKPTWQEYIGMYGILFTCLFIIALILAYNNRTKD